MSQVKTEVTREIYGNHIVTVVEWSYGGEEFYTYVIIPRALAVSHARKARAAGDPRSWRTPLDIAKTFLRTPRYARPGGFFSRQPSLLKKTRRFHTYVQRSGFDI